MKSILHPKKYSTTKRCGIIFIDNDKYLVVQGNSGIWSFPKGRVNENENDINCALREVLEETGVKLEEKDIIYCNKIKIDYNIYFILPTSIEYIKGIKQEHTDKYEVIDIQWLSLKELKELSCNKDIRRIIRNPSLI